MLNQTILVAATVIITVLVIYNVFVSVMYTKTKEELKKQTELARQCMNAKEGAESGFYEAKKFFEDQLKRPIAVNITDDQIQEISNRLGGMLLPYVRTGEVIRTIQ